MAISRGPDKNASMASIMKERRRLEPLQILCEITSVRTSFRSCAGGVMACGEA